MIRKRTSGTDSADAHGVHKRLAARFQEGMDKARRRELGAHYTDEENVLRLAGPLFLDELWEEFELAKADDGALRRLHDKISRLKFLDPACGAGAFLIVSYRELRRLELEILKMKKAGDRANADAGLFPRVNAGQFFGIECEEIPRRIALDGMRLMDRLMDARAAEQLGERLVRPPPAGSAAVVHANALRIDWNDVVPREELTHILGNPPFNGARTMTPAQKDDMRFVFGRMKGAGDLDYAAAWFKKAADTMEGARIRAAFVATGSLCRGEQAALLWKPLVLEKNMRLDFARQPFRWTSEAGGRAAVHCVVVGFGAAESGRQRRIVDGDGKAAAAKRINPYLVDAPDVFIHSRPRPLCDAPAMSLGNQPIDGGNYLFTEEERDEFLKTEPAAEKWFRPWFGSVEFINRRRRYFLYLRECGPEELRRLPECRKRVEKVRLFRLASKRPLTRRLAETPCEFAFANISRGTFCLVPEVSSERRAYIPIGFMTPDVLCSNLVKVVADATLYHFGVLTSRVHMAWTRTVCGRLEMRYRYSSTLVYNNFPWPEPTGRQKAAIEAAALGVLDARAAFPERSYADLYGPATMPPELLRAHRALDRAVARAYRYRATMSEADIVADLMERHRILAGP